MLAHAGIHPGDGVTEKITVMGRLPEVRHVPAPFSLGVVTAIKPEMKVRMYHPVVVLKVGVSTGSWTLGSDTTAK